MPTVDIQGDVDSGWEPIADVFADNFAARGERGAALCLVVDGRIVVDVWAGIADERTGRPWTAETAAPVFSCSKGILTVCAYLLVQNGRLDLDAPVERYWPGFGRAGKSAVTVRSLLDHRAGLPTIDAELTLDEVLAWHPVVDALERQEPFWEPGTRHSYHTITFGWLIGEVIRRITGTQPGEFFRKEIAEPRTMRTWIGLPRHELDAVVRTVGPPEDERPVGADPILTRARTLNGAIPFPVDDRGKVAYNEPRVQTAGIPAAGGVSTARDLARLYASCVSDLTGPRLLTDESVEDAIRLRSDGQEVYGPPFAGRRWGTGFMLDGRPARRMLGARSFGHDGAGGHLSFGDDTRDLGFAYVTSRMRGPADDRANRLTAAVRQCCGIADA